MSKKTLFILALALAALATVWGYITVRQNRERVHEITDEMAQTLGAVRIQRFELSDATVDEAVTHLNAMARQHGLPQNIQIERWPLPTPPPGFLKAEEPASALIFEGLLPIPPPTSHSVALSDVPLNEALRYIAGMFDGITAQRGDVIYLIDEPSLRGGTFSPLVKSTFRWPSSPGLASPPKHGQRDMKPYFKQNGVQFYETSEAYLLRNGKLIVRNSQNDIDLISAILGTMPEPSLLLRIKVWVLETVEGDRLGTPPP
ncbi:MAG: hypothetical protein ACO1QR_04490 [Chthoniobacteraceae bacterium]